MDVLLKIACRQLMNAIDGDGAAAVMLNADGEYELLVDEPEIKDSTLHMLPETPLLKRLRESSGIFSVEDAGEESELKDLYALYCEPRQIRSILIVPLLAGVNFEGWLFLYRNEPHRHNPSEIELARTIANQLQLLYRCVLFQERGA